MAGVKPTNFPLVQPDFTTEIYTQTGGVNGKYDVSTLKDFLETFQDVDNYTYYDYFGTGINFQASTSNYEGWLNELYVDSDNYFYESTANKENTNSGGNGMFDPNYSRKILVNNDESSTILQSKEKYGILVEDTDLSASVDIFKDDFKILLSDTPGNTSTQYEQLSNEISLEKSDTLGNYNKAIIGVSNTQIIGYNVNDGINTNLSVGYNQFLVETNNPGDFKSSVKSISTQSRLRTQNSDDSESTQIVTAPTSATMQYSDFNTDTYAQIYINDTSSNVSYSAPGGIDTGSISVKTLGDGFVGFEMLGIRDYVDLAAAQTAGLISGQVFRIGHQLCIVP
jgi:hypothetical protein